MDRQEALDLIEREFRALEQRVDSYRGETRDLTVAMLNVVRENAEASVAMVRGFRELKEGVEASLKEFGERLDANTNAILALLDRFENGGSAAQA